MRKELFSIIVLIIIILSDILFFRILPFFIRPNLFLAYIVFFALFFGHTETVIWSFFIGAILDFIYLKIFGINTLLFLIIGYLIGWLNKRVDERLKKVQIIILLLASVLYFLLYFLFSLIFNLSVKFLSLFFLNIISTVIFGYFQIQIFIFLYKSNKLISLD